MKMKIALIGFGQMGLIINDIAKARGHTIITVDPNNPNANYKSVEQLNQENFDCSIDFSLPSTVVGNITKLLAMNKPIVIGTTGWYENIDNVREMVLKSNTALIYATNFSIGVNIFKAIVENASKIINKFDNYDVSGLEIHHNKKIDSPSGTAKTLAETIIKNLSRKDKITYDCIDRKIEANELQFVSQRVGSIPGTHQITIDSNEDTITLTHTARNRSGFALGAVLASEWIVDKKGFFSAEDFFKNIGI
jgi:4-hydroxy-tetrahydrodipicolinate reductase